MIAHIKIQNRLKATRTGISIFWHATLNKHLQYNIFVDGMVELVDFVLIWCQTCVTQDIDFKTSNVK